MIARFSANGERELSTLDFALPAGDTSGGVLVRLTLHHSERRLTEHLAVEGKPGIYADGKRFILRLDGPLELTLRIDLAGLHAQAAKAARSKSGKAKSGPVTVRGGQRAKWLRENIE
jgi:hypothetical protein